jgi:hypothetical protein
VTPGKTAARWRNGDEVFLDHATLTTADAEWLTPVRRLTLGAVKVPDGLLASLPNLEYLDLSGGSGTSVSLAAGCRRLRYLQVNQVRGVADLSVLPTLTQLELVSLYGLPQVTQLPSLAPLARLRRVQLGSLKGLTGLTGVHEAPSLRELVLIRRVGVAADDASRLASHPTLTCFYWFGEDVPVRIWVPFRDAVGKPPARVVDAAAWLDANAGS